VSANCQTLEDWLKESKNDWGWQIIIDALAIGESLPLRIVRFDKLQNLYYIITKEYEFQKKYPNKKNWDDDVIEIVKWSRNLKNNEDNSAKQLLLKQLVDIYPKLASEIFPILPANPFPMEMLSRISFEEYRVFCLLWFYHWLVISSQALISAHESASLKKDSLSFPTMGISANRIDSDSYRNWLLIIGPYWGGDVSMLSSQEYDEKTVHPVIKFIEHFSNGIGQKRLFHKHRFRRAALEASPLSIEELTKRQNRINISLSQLLKCEISSLNGMPTRHDLYHIALWSLFNTLQEDTTQIKEILEQQSGSLVFHYGEDHVSKENKERAHQPVCLSVCLNTNNNLELSILKKNTLPVIHEDNAKKQISQFGLILQHSRLATDITALNKIRARCSRFYIRINRKNRSLDSTRLMIISDRLHRELGSDERGTSLGGICQWLSGLLRSEVTFLYRYDMHEGVHGSFEVENSSYYGLKEEEYKNILIDMQHIDSKIDLERSIAYRAVIENESQICYWYDPEKKISIPKNKGLYHSEKNKNFPLKSSIAVPLRFNGRCQGAITVSARQPWRFSWEQQILAEQAASVIAPYFYNRRFLRELNNINSIVVNFHHEKIGIDYLYNQICNSLASMFLCEGANLWICNEVETELLKKKGSHKIEIDTNKINLRDKKRLIPYMINLISEQEQEQEQEQEKNNNQSFITKSIQELPKELTEFIALKENGINHIALLPLYESNNDLKVMAVIMLFTRDVIGFKDSWNSIMSHVSKYIKFVVEAVNAFIHNRNGVSNLIHHEIWRDAVILVRKASVMADDKQDLLQKLTLLTSKLRSDWFTQKLKEATLIGDWRPEDVFAAENLVHRIKTTWFLPHQDMLKIAKRLDTRIKALYVDNKKRNFIDQRSKLLAEIGDEEIVNLIISENEEVINIKDNCMQILSKLDAISKKGLFISIDDQLPRIRTQPINFESVLHNILVNAVKYSINNSSIDITIQNRRFGGVRLIIENKGIPMVDSKECIAVVQKGIRGSNVNSQSGEGKGLYIVEKLCRHVLKYGFTFNMENQDKEKSIALYQVILEIPSNCVLSGKDYEI